MLIYLCTSEFDDTIGRISDSTDLKGSMQYPDSLEGTGNYAQYAQTLEDMFTYSEKDLQDKRKSRYMCISLEALIS